MVEALKERPAYVTFEVRSVKDNNASIEAGHYVGKDVVFALITPMGSKDRIERVAAEWFAKLQRDVQESRLPREFYNLYKAVYDDFLAGRETPVNGVALENWPAMTPTLRNTLVSIGVRTVEDLAAANEEVIRRMGMGGRAWKQKAEDYLKAASTTGKVSEELSSLKAQNADLQKSNEDLQAKVQMLSAKMEELITASEGKTKKL